MEESKKEVSITRAVNASPDRVYKAWTDPQLVAQWWGPKGVTIPICEIDVKVGGRIYIVMEAGEEMGSLKGMQWPMDGTFVELEEPKKIVFHANAITAGKVILEQQTTVLFHEEDGKTIMQVHAVITKAYPGSEFAISGMEQGWNEQFDKLVDFIQKVA